MIISPWPKAILTLFVCVLVPVYWVEYGPANFLWASHIALLLTVVALWTENRLLPSMMAVAVLLPEIGWTIDFDVRLVLGPEGLPTRGTQYMFNPEIGLFVRVLALFHVLLPGILVWLLSRLGYDRRALLYQTLLAWVVLPITYVVTDASANVNWVYGFGHEPQTWVPGPVFVAFLMAAFPLAIYLPTHLLLSRLLAGGCPVVSS